MKKIFMVMAVILMSAMIISCDNQNKKIAVQCLEQNLKCPSTLNIVSYELNDEIPNVIEETNIYGHIKYCYSSEYIKGFKTSVVLDSVYEIVEKSYATNKDTISLYKFIYDSQNSYGAMIRDTSFIVIKNNITEFYNNFEEIKKYLKTDTIYNKVEVDYVFITDVLLFEKSEYVHSVHPFNKFSKFKTEHNGNIIYNYKITYLEGCSKIIF